MLTVLLPFRIVCSPSEESPPHLMEPALLYYLCSLVLAPSRSTAVRTSDTFAPLLTFGADGTLSKTHDCRAAMSASRLTPGTHIFAPHLSACRCIFSNHGRGRHLIEIRNKSWTLPVDANVRVLMLRSHDKRLHVRQLRQSGIDAQALQACSAALSSTAHH